LISDDVRAMIEIPHLRLALDLSLYAPHMSSNDKPIPAPALNQFARALARWENEGGATFSSLEEGDEEQVVLSLADQDILQRLGTAVIAQWTELPTDVQKALFQRAVTSGDPRHSTDLREQIARFLHTHKSNVYSQSSDC
jgi:hypothetical protein